MIKTQTSKIWRRIQCGWRWSRSGAGSAISSTASSQSRWVLGSSQWKFIIFHFYSVVAVVSTSTTLCFMLFARISDNWWRLNWQSILYVEFDLLAQMFLTCSRMGFEIQTHLIQISMRSTALVQHAWLLKTGHLGIRGSNNPEIGDDLPWDTEVWLHRKAKSICICSLAMSEKLVASKNDYMCLKNTGWLK